LKELAAYRYKRIDFEPILESKYFLMMNKNEFNVKGLPMSVSAWNILAAISGLEIISCSSKMIFLGKYYSFSTLY
jgi:hypothetical protein